MHEYEFRFVVTHFSSFDSFFQNLGYATEKKVVYYAKPHFRFKNGTWETKRVESTKSVYHDNVWFKWVHSIETPYRYWSRSVSENFLHQVGNFQDPLVVETRDFVQIDSQAQLYAFQSDFNEYKLVFEWEFGTFKTPQTNFQVAHLFESLTKYKHVYDSMKRYSTPPYQLNENLTRKPVTYISEILMGKQYLYAHKLDGEFGLVYSYRDNVKEKWENYECVIHKNVTLGDGFVFAAEKLENGKVVLLDIYQVRGHDAISWCKKDVLLNFLPQLKLIKGYFVQTYFTDKNELDRPPPFKVDGVIVHDIEKDVVFKYKTHHSIDLVYFKGYFYLPNGRIKCLKEDEEKELENGRVYEVSTTDGRVIRKRNDRFKGNTQIQIDRVLAFGWHGPPIETVDFEQNVLQTKVKRRNKKK